jgi:predicted XRE-type DNA-binding protein
MTHGAKNGSALGPPEPPEARLKLLLMDCIDEGIRQRYRTLQEAAHVSNINRELLSRVRRGEHRRCSIAALLSIAEQLQIHIRINVRLVRRKKVAISATKSAVHSRPGNPEVRESIRNDMANFGPDRPQLASC